MPCRVRSRPSTCWSPAIKKVATIHDKKAYGQGLVAAFTEAFKSGGGEIVASETINPDDKDFSAVISKVKGGQPGGWSTTAVSTRRPGR